MIKLNKTKLKYITDFLSGFGFPDELQGTNEGEIPFLKVSDINGDEREVEVANNYVSKKLALSKSWKLIPPRSILMAKIGAALSKNHRKINKISVIIDNNMMAAVPKKIDYSFHYWLWRTIDLKDFQNISSVPSVDMTTLKDLFIQLPDLIQQKQIAYYLDQKVAKIDEAITKKKQLINLLEEKRTITINNSIQNANGIKTKIKHVVKINPTTKNNFKFSESASFIPMEAVSEDGVVNLQERKIQNVISGYTYFEENDVVIAKITPCFENGKAAVMKGLVNGFGFGTTEFIILRSGKKIMPEYLYYLIFSRHFRENGTNEMRGTAGQKRLTESYVGHYSFNLPSRENQLKIIENIKNQLSIIDNAKDKLDESVALLEEYKISLISNAVTGRVKI